VRCGPCQYTSQLRRSQPKEAYMVRLSEQLFSQSRFQCRSRWVIASGKTMANQLIIL
jgi:hypothetical protein